MTVAVVLFTSDLRTHDHPPLHAAVAAADEVVPLFVRDPGIREAGFAVPNRDAFLADCLADLDASLRGLGGRLVLRSGPVAPEVCAVAAESGATQVYMAAGVTGYAHCRERRLRDALRRQGVTLRVYEGVVTAVAPGAVTPALLRSLRGLHALLPSVVEGTPARAPARAARRARTRRGARRGAAVPHANVRRLAGAVGRRRNGGTRKVRTLVQGRPGTLRGTARRHGR